MSLIDYSVKSIKVDTAIDVKAGFVDVTLSLNSRGSNLKLRLSHAEFNYLFEKFQKAHNEVTKR